VTAALALIPLVGCGSDDRQAGDLVWVGRPTLLRPPDLPRDHILRGTVRNGSLRKIALSAGDLELKDGKGHTVAGRAVFLSAFTKRLYPSGQEPSGGLPEIEKRRLGIVARIPPGKTAPLTMSWREYPGTRPAVRIDYGLGSLPVPRG
jgi:hypothetical protein